MKDWMITIKKEYADAILAGDKKFEVRTRVPASLCPNDRIIVHVSGSGDRVDFAFMVESVQSYAPKTLYLRHRRCLCIRLDDYLEYTKHRRLVFAIGIGDVIRHEHVLSMSALGVLHAPQWFTKVQ